MDSYRIEFARSATKDLRDIDRQWIPRIFAAIEQLAENPLPIGCKKLVGSEHTYRIRVGDYRIVYDMKNNDLVVYVIRVRHRRDVYKEQSIPQQIRDSPHNLRLTPLVRVAINNDKSHKSPYFDLHLSHIPSIRKKPPQNRVSNRVPLSSRLPAFS